MLETVLALAKGVADTSANITSFYSYLNVFQLEVFYFIRTFE